MKMLKYIIFLVKSFLGIFFLVTLIIGTCVSLIKKLNAETIVIVIFCQDMALGLSTTSHCINRVNGFSYFVTYQKTLLLSDSNTSGSFTQDDDAPSI